METEESQKHQPLELNNPEQEAKVLDGLAKWLFTSATDSDVKLVQAGLVVRGVSLRLRGIDPSKGLQNEDQH